MVEEKLNNTEDSVEEPESREELTEPLVESEASTANRDTEGFAEEEILQHCEPHFKGDRLEWTCDAEAHRDRLAKLLKKEPVITLETKKSQEG